MYRNIRQSFIETLDRTAWMDEKTQEKALEKVNLFGENSLRHLILTTTSLNCFTCFLRIVMHLSTFPPPTRYTWLLSHLKYLAFCKFRIPSLKSFFSLYFQIKYTDELIGYVSNILTEEKLEDLYGGVSIMQEYSPPYHDPCQRVRFFQLHYKLLEILISQENSYLSHNPWRILQLKKVPFGIYERRRIFNNYVKLIYTFKWLDHFNCKFEFTSLGNDTSSETENWILIN